MQTSEAVVFATVKEAAERIGVSERYIRTRTGERSIPFIYSGKKILVNVPKTIEILTAESEENLK